MNFNDCLSRTFHFLGQPRLLGDLDEHDFSGKLKLLKDKQPISVFCIVHVFSL